MTTYRPLATGQHLLSLALAALVTVGVLTSLGAQADVQHADVLAGAQTRMAAGQPLCPPATGQACS